MTESLCRNLLPSTDVGTAAQLKHGVGILPRFSVIAGCAAGRMGPVGALSVSVTPPRAAKCATTGAGGPTTPQHTLPSPPLDGFSCCYPRVALAGPVRGRGGAMWCHVVAYMGLWRVGLAQRRVLRIGSDAGPGYTRYTL